jgi:hypothetical protein
MNLINSVLLAVLVSLPLLAQQSTRIKPPFLVKVIEPMPSNPQFFKTMLNLSRNLDSWFVKEGQVRMSPCKCSVTVHMWQVNGETWQAVVKRLWLRGPESIIQWRGATFNRSVNEKQATDDVTRLIVEVSDLPPPSVVLRKFPPPPTPPPPPITPSRRNIASTAEPVPKRDGRRYFHFNQ